MKVIHATSTSAGPIAAISQSSTAAGAKSWNIMLPMRLSPQLRTAGPSGGRVRLQRGEGALDDRDGLPLTTPVVVEALVVEVLVEPRLAVLRPGEERRGRASPA